MEAPCSEIIGDIEDLIEAQEIAPKERYSSKKKITVRSKKNKVEEYIEPTIFTSSVPGSQKIHIKTWGCAHNSSDSEYMAGLLSSYGYKLTDNPEEADLWLLNSCTVKGPAETHFRNEVEKGQKMGKHIVAAGCVPQGAPRSSYLQNLSVIGVQNIDRVVEVVEETLKGHSVRLFSQKKENGKKLGGAKLLLPKIRKNPYIEIIPISTGCLNQCTYCKTKHARGELGSYPVEEIVERAKQAFSEGVVELWLTSEDTGAYGKDIGTSLPQLLWNVIGVIPNNCRMRVGMTNPPYILEHLEEMAKILSHDKVYSFLHVPVQSGSDAVLGDMKREYTVSDFKHVVDFLKERVPGITIATDIICGFPTETEKDFEDTMALCQQYKFPSLFTNQFYPRPGTPAAKMVKIPTQEVKKRTKRLSDWFHTYEPYSHKLGEVQEVLVTEVAHDNKHFVGHNKFYEQVLVPKNNNFMGKVLKIRVVETKKHCLIGEPVNELFSAAVSRTNLSLPSCEDMVINSEHLTLMLLTALSLMDKKEHLATNGYRLDTNGSARERLDLAKRILAEVPLIDGHNDLPWNIRKFVHNRLRDFNLNTDLRNLPPWSKSPWSQTDLPRLKQGMIGGQFWAAYVPCESQHLNAVQLTLEQIDVIKRLIDKFHRYLKFATSATEILEAHQENKIASLIGVEGGHSIGNSLAILRIFYDLGVRYMTLTHTCNTPWADSSSIEHRTKFPNNGGLTSFGKAVVKEMNRLGMMVDLSHTSVSTMRDVLETTEAPIIFSHSSAHALCNTSRNVPDDILKLVAKNGGIVMVTFYNQFVKCGTKATVADVAEHISYIRNWIGVDHVGVGGDFDGINKTPRGLEDVSMYPELFAELLRSGVWSEEDLRKVAGLNLLRVFNKVEKVRDEMKIAGALPSEELIFDPSSGKKFPCSTTVDESDENRESC